MSEQGSMGGTVSRTVLAYVDVRHIKTTELGLTARQVFHEAINGTSDFRIASCDKEFLELLEVEQGTIAPIFVKVSDLTELALDTDILNELGNPPVTLTLTQFYPILKQQGQGEAGILHTDTNTNVFYIVDAAGLCRSVASVFHPEYGGWFIGTREVTEKSRWHGKVRFLSV